MAHSGPCVPGCSHSTANPPRTLPPPSFGDLGLCSALPDFKSTPCRRPFVALSGDSVGCPVHGIRAPLESATAANRAWARFEELERFAADGMRAYLANSPKVAAWTLGDVAAACRRAEAAGQAHALACARARGENPQGD